MGFCGRDFGFFRCALPPNKLAPNRAGHCLVLVGTVSTLERTNQRAPKHRLLIHLAA